MFLSLATAGTTVAAEPISVSGIYPHLTVYNFDTAGECGIGAVVPWAGKLWLMTYPPHYTTGSEDKLFSISPDMTMTIHPESVGGTHAGRMIHRESNQLIMGPYFISADGKVRACDVKNKLKGRMTAVARHLTDPANKVYEFDMEGAIYEINVHTLEVTRLFEKPVPGWHGKGGYTSQGRLVIANNGEHAAGKVKNKFLAGEEAKSPEDAGILAEWDGKTWRIIERRQFTDVTGPGGIEGAPDDKSPLWAIGWDKRSVILKLLDGGTWSTFRLPKASHCYDPKHGFYTEWPRIREGMMDMHGMFYDFPKTFSAANTGGIVPIASHLRYIPDFCYWNGRLVLASDDTSIMANKRAGKSQSNLWFGKRENLSTFGPRAGWGGPWQNDAVKAGEPSVPFLVKGFNKRVIHLAADNVVFTLEIDKDGNGQWIEYKKITVDGYTYHIFPAEFDAAWLRVKTDKDCTASAFLHQFGPRDTSKDKEPIFVSLAGLDEKAVTGVIRPAKHNRNLQFISETGYSEVDENLHTVPGVPEHRAEAETLLKIAPDFTVDDASVIMTQGKTRYRLPKTDEFYDKFVARGIRECVSERNLANIHGTFYEIPRGNLIQQIKPVATHHRQIQDFCTWRGLMVLTGTKPGTSGLWFGSIDDLWHLGKPTGHGGPWLKTAVKADKPSDPYLMTNYDQKTLTLSHDSKSEVTFTILINFDHTGWHPYATLKVPAGVPVEHKFPDGFNAHWVRVTADRDCTATAQLDYQ